MYPDAEVALWRVSREGWLPALFSDHLDVSLHDFVSLEYRASLIGRTLDVREHVSEMHTQVSDLPNVVGLFGDGRHAFQGPGVVPDPVVAIHA